MKTTRQQFLLSDQSLTWEQKTLQAILDYRHALTHPEFAALHGGIETLRADMLEFIHIGVQPRAGCADD